MESSFCTQILLNFFNEACLHIIINAMKVMGIVKLRHLTIRVKIITEFYFWNVGH